MLAGKRWTKDERGEEKSWSLSPTGDLTTPAVTYLPLLPSGPGGVGKCAPRKTHRVRLQQISIIPSGVLKCKNVRIAFEKRNEGLFSEEQALASARRGC